MDTLALLATKSADVWVATASAVGAAHLVPLSLLWTGERVVIAIERSSVSAHNLTATAEVRVAAGLTRDVVMIDGAVESAVDVSTDAALAEAYVAQADWNPRETPGYIFVVIRPLRVQAWRVANEIAGRTIMRNGMWLV